MANTLSNMLPLGTIAPNFELLNTISAKTLKLNDLKGKHGTVIMFICNHCPFVIHVNNQLIKMANDYTKLGISFIAISSNDEINFPQDGPENMKIHALNEGYPFPYLFDKTQNIAKAYDAACTPDFYAFDKSLKLVYRGQIDNSRPRNGLPVTGVDLRHALDCLLADKENTLPQKPSIGCSIKWKH